MEKPKLEHKAYKKIVPLKGSLLQKLKNELKKELSKNDTDPIENGNNNTINNNTEINEDPTVISPSKTPEKRISEKCIIQKVENVKIEMITTSPKGSLRRLSDLFTPVPKRPLFSAPEIVSPVHIAGNKETNYENPSLVENFTADDDNHFSSNRTDTSHSSISLLSTKIPGNSFNQKVPLKVIRTLKPKPNLRLRHHRVETFKAVELPSPEIEPNDVNFEVAIELLIPDVQTIDAEPATEELFTAKVPEETSDQLQLVVQNSSKIPALQDGQLSEYLPEQKTLVDETELNFSLKEKVTEETQNSDQDDSFKGFSIDETNSCEGSVEWFEILKMCPIDKQRDIAQIFDLELDMSKQQSPPRSDANSNVIKTQTIVRKPRTNKKKANAVEYQSESSNDVNHTISTNSKPSQKVCTVKENQLGVQDAFEISSEMMPSSSETSPKEEPICGDPVKPVQESAEGKIPTSPKNVHSLSMPEKLKKQLGFVKNNEEKKGEPDWKNDILIVLGASRIKEIDKKLKSIPNLVTGNAIETENVELKLIIRHLMRKFKVSSIMATLSKEEFNQTHESSLDEDDDDFPDSFDDDSNGPNTFFDRASDSFDTSAFEDEERDNSAQKDDADGSHNSFSTHNEVVMAIENIATEPETSDPITQAMHIETDFSYQPSSIISYEETEVNDTPEVATNEVEKEDEPIRVQTRRGKKRTYVSQVKPKQPRKKLRSHSSNISRENPIEPMSEKDHDSLQKQVSSTPLVTVEEIAVEKSDERKKIEQQSLTHENAATSLEKVEIVKKESRKKSRSIPLDRRSSRSSPEFPTRNSRRNKEKISITEEKTSISVKRRATRKIIYSSSDSESNDITSDSQKKSSRNMELESRLMPIDSNSKRKPSIFIRNDYIKPTDRKSNVNAGISQTLQKLSKVIAAKKKNDPTYVEPPLFEKRERLRTSAFKGKIEKCVHDKDIRTDSEPETRPSLSRESSVDSAIVQTNSDKSRSSQVSSLPQPLPRKRGRQKKNLDETANAVKREFLQKPLEPAIEKLVPYKNIIETIISGTTPKTIGRANLKTVKENEEKKTALKKDLEALKYFTCGSCHCDITKHLWLDHFLEHGGIAWIDSFDAPISLEDWNEALRRTLRNYKIYNVDIMTCPNCLTEKRSALSHLSHLLVCAESDEVVEKRKVTCELCNEKYFPFNATLHKNKCSGYQKLQAKDDVSETESEEEAPEECLNLSGRTKRKAVQRAEKQFKKVLKSLNKPSDHLDLVGGQLKCHFCGQTDFESQDDALDHIKTEHDLGHDFENGSDSDEDLQVADESSDETDGSSGVESSEISSSEDDFLLENGDSFVSSKKARTSACEPQEVKNGLALITEYVEALRGQDIPTKTFQWTKEFADENWKAEVFPQILPKFNPLLNEEPKTLLPSLQFRLKSLKFGIKQTEEYVQTYENGSRKSWQQLEIGDDYSNKESSTIYCGGSVASLDWAPVSSGHPNFLAVACNIESQGIQINLTECIKSCLQVYEFQHIQNKSFNGFQKKSRLNYVIVIDNGPVWEIKFHPSESAAQTRIGLLAVTTASQRILIYSMPYLNNDKPSVLSLQPNLICKLQQDEVLFNDEFLLQALKLAWHHKSDHDSVLAAGFVSGVVGIWNISSHHYSEKSESNIIYPHHVIQAHFEPVTALDFKTTDGTDFHLLTASGDRKLKVFTFDELSYQETASFYSTSRVLCAEWWMHWPGYLFGIDDCFTFGQLMYRQPLEFGTRSVNLMNVSSPTIDLSINHWMNVAIFVSNSGDVIGCRPKQMLTHFPKDRWDHFKFNLYSYTDFNKILNNGVEEIGIIFGDFKRDMPQPKKFRVSPTERINELQINQVCFNRNEESCRFYALGYETGFVRIKYLKNSK